jgi:type IV pilus secretin PilQ/predicted competence protein
MRRNGFVLLTVMWLMLGMVIVPGSPAWGASETATLKSVTLSASSRGTELVVRVDGDFTYKTVQAGTDTLFIDIANAKADGIAGGQEWTNPVFGGYKLMSFKDASGQPVVRIQVETKLPNSFVAFKDGSTLRLIKGVGSGAIVPTVAESPAPAAPVAVNTQAPAASAPFLDTNKPLLVSKVTLDKHDSGETFVDVATSRSASFHVMTLPSPARLVVDIDGAESTSPTRTYEADTTVLKAVRVAQFRANDPAVVRVVAVLTGNPAFDVHTTSSGVRIELRPRGTAKTIPLVNNAPAPQVKPAEKVVETAAVSAPVAPAPAVDSPAPKPAESNDGAKPDVQSTLPTSTTEQAAAAPLPPPAASTPEALRADRAAEVLNPARESSLAEAQTQTPATPVTTATESKPVYTGEPVTFNLKDLDLKDFFRLIHEISGLNIIVDPNVSGSVTIVLDSVPWDQALDIVLKNNDLGKVLEGNVLRIAKMSTLTGEQDAQTKLAESRINAAPLVTVFRPINYATAAAIQTILKSWTGGGALSRRGTALVDARTNTLIISDVASQIPIIEAIIAKLDKKAKQVSIEARVVLATADFTRILSAALSGAGLNGSGTTTFGVATGSTASITGPTVASGTTNSMTITSPTGAGFGNIAITNATARYLINGVITAQEEQDRAKTISRPTIVTQNNVQGTVQQGVQIPIQTTINNTISVSYIAATLELVVTPQVTDDNNIFLVINVNNASPGAPVANVGAEINTQQATTSVLVPDGGTVVFGGITVTNRSKTATYVPWLGSIPLLGHLFKSETTTDSDQELLFFVSPKILPG